MILSYDTETNGLDLHTRHSMFAFSTCTPDEKVEVRRLERVGSLPKLVQLFSNPNFVPVMHNAKFDLTATELKLGKRLAETITFHDTMIQSHILQSNHPNHKLKQLAWELAGIPSDDEKEVKKYVDEDEPDYSLVPSHIMDEYQRLDAIRTMILHLFFYPKICASPAYLDNYNMELDLIRTTMRMEARGIMLDFKATDKLIFRLENEIDEVLDYIEKFAGRRINPNKTAEIRWLLFDVLNLPSIHKTAKAGLDSTGKDVLLQLRIDHPHPLIEAIIKFRSYWKGVKTLKGYARVADADGIIHPNIRTCGASTGRESVSRPPLQTVPKDQVLLNPYPIPARHCFRPRIGYVHFHIDYSGIQMRIAVHYSGEPELRKIIMEGGDIHLPATLLFWGDRYRNAPKDKQKVLRGATKNTNFAIIFGASAKEAAYTLGQPLSEFNSKLREYKRRWPKLGNMAHDTIREAYSQGFITTEFGRDIQIRREEAFVAPNYRIQGTEADIVKRAQPRVHRVLERETGGEAKLLLPIHDELIIEYPRTMLGDAMSVLRKVREVMIDFPQLKVPLEIEVDVATLNWADKKPFAILD